MAFCPLAANASDEQTKIDQLETLLQFYMQENATLKLRVKELEASVGADAASTQGTVASGDKSESTSASAGSVEMDEIQATAVASPSSGYKIKFPNLDDTAICDYATYVSETSGKPERVWSSGLVADRYVNDAQKRGLTCGVGDGVAVRKDTVSEQESIAVSSDYKTRYPDLDDPAICDYATYVSKTSGEPERVWSSGLVANRYVEDAKNRGLTCGVGEVVQISAEKAETNVVDIKHSLPALDYSLIEGREASSINVSYDGRSAYYETKWRENYNDFPFYEIICRVVFEANWVGLKNLNELKAYLRSNRCTEANFEDDRYILADMVQGGVRLDIDGDGIRDLLVFLYGWQVDNPLRMVAFKYKWETNPESLESPIERLFTPEEVFASGEYPEVQNTRFIHTADFNEDGKVDIFYSDGGYDNKPFAIYPSKIFLSSNAGYIVKNLTKPLKIHGSAVGDVNGDGHFDIYIGKSVSKIIDWSNRNDENPTLYLGDGRGNFQESSKSLPGLAKSKNEQVQFAEFLDVDSDGALDLITGGQCGKKSYIFWNDGKGSYDNSNKTTIPLDYKKWGKRKCGDFYNTITQIFLLEDEGSNKVYFGTTSSKHYKGNRFSLFELKGRTLGENISPLQDEVDTGFAYKMELTGPSAPLELALFDFYFRKVRYSFDTQTKKFIKSDANNRNLNFRWPRNKVISR